MAGWSKWGFESCNQWIDSRHRQLPGQTGGGNQFWRIYIEYIVTGDRIDIVYSKTAIAGATVQISVGGVPVDSFDISGGVSYGNVYHYTLGLPATYTVRLTAVGATVGVDGLVVFHGDYDAGLSYWECTRGGATSAFFQPAPAAIHGASDGWANANLHLVIDSLYGNDYLEPGGVATPSTVVTRLQARVARYKALANNPDVILLLYWGLSTYNGDNSLGYNHDDYRVAIKAVADDEGCKIINLYDIYGMAPGSYFSGDGLHPNNTGHQAIADGILDAITGYFAP